MPELPEVETVARDLRRAGIVGRTIRDLTVRWPRTLDRPSVEEARARLRGSRVTDVRRRGKYLLLDLDSGQVLLIHLRMTGRLDFYPARAPLDEKHDHLILHLDGDEELRFHDTRKFGRVWLVEQADEIVGRLGPEPIDRAFTLDDFRQRLAGRRTRIKPLLLDQHVVAGLGNIYVSESLHRAGIDPRRAAGRIGRPRLDDLASQIKDAWRAN